MSMRCHTNTCPTGIATQDPSRQRRLVVPHKALRVDSFHQKTIHNLKDLRASVGLLHPNDLQPYHLYKRISRSEAKSIDRI